MPSGFRPMGLKGERVWNSGVPRRAMSIPARRRTGGHDLPLCRVLPQVRSALRPSHIITPPSAVVESATANIFSA